MKSPLTENTLFYGDNLPILRDHIPADSIDLVYLDPPFNSNRTYNVLFRRETGEESEDQIAAFEDTWHWSGAAEHDVRVERPCVAAQRLALFTRDDGQAGRGRPHMVSG